MNRTTIRQLAVRLNGGVLRGSSKALAQAMGVPAKTARAWLLDPTQENHRVMSKSAKRLFTFLVVLDSTGKLDNEFMLTIIAMEKVLDAAD